MLCNIPENGILLQHIPHWKLHGRIPPQEPSLVPHISVLLLLVLERGIPQERYIDVNSKKQNSRRPPTRVWSRTNLAPSRL